MKLGTKYIERMVLRKRGRDSSEEESKDPNKFKKAFSDGQK